MTPRVLITGGAIRLGAAMARAFARAGCDVVIHYRSSRGPADALVAELRALGVAAEAHGADLTDPEAPARLAAAVGPVDILINSAGAWDRVPFADIDGPTWEAMQALNCRAPFLLSQACLPHLQASALPGGGVILNITDIAARRPVPGYVHYCVSKAGLEMLTQALALELAPAVRVNGIAPGTVLAPTDLSAEALDAIVATIPAGAVGRADDIADAAVFLALRAPYVTGQILAVDGGRSLGGPMEAG